MKALTHTDYQFPDQVSVYHGKVRDVYDIAGRTLVMVATDRISAFDVILPEGIPYKGQVLNQIAAKFLDATTDICPNWKQAAPDPMVTIGVRCQSFPVEMIVRGYLCGSAWRAYKSGVREICGVPIPDGMRENQRFEHPIVTPTTKAEIGTHDEDISKAEIIARGLMSPEDYEVVERYAKGEPQRQLSKEFVREWLMEHGFQGKPGQRVPEMTPAIVSGISDRYIELYEHITGEPFVRHEGGDLIARIERNVKDYLQQKA